MPQASKLLDGRADKLFCIGRLASKGKLPNTYLEVQIVTFFLKKKIREVLILSRQVCELCEGRG